MYSISRARGAKASSATQVPTQRVLLLGTVCAQVAPGVNDHVHGWTLVLYRLRVERQNV